MAERELVWKTRTWLITFILELDVASGTGRKSRMINHKRSLGRLTSKLMKLNNTHSTHIKGQGEWIVKESHMAGNSRVIIDNTSTIGDIVSTELPAIMTRLQSLQVLLKSELVRMMDGCTPSEKGQPTFMDLVPRRPHLKTMAFI
jgi:hypothetical protein